MYILGVSRLKFIPHNKKKNMQKKTNYNCQQFKYAFTNFSLQKSPSPSIKGESWNLKYRSPKAKCLSLLDHFILKRENFNKIFMSPIHFSRQFELNRHFFFFLRVKKFMFKFTTSTISTKQKYYL